MKLSIDIETYSSYDLADTGVYKYTEAEDFTILLFAYSFDHEPGQVVDLTREQLPQRVMDALLDNSTTLHAHNAAFERICINKYLGIEMPIIKWHCTMVHAACLGLPMSLAVVAKVLGLDVQKDTRGKSLIGIFCKPCKPTKSNGGRTRNTPTDKPEEWQEFINYCRRDVEVEQQVYEKVSFYQIPQQERDLWVLDQQINDRGVAVDMELVEQAIRISIINHSRMVQRAVAITGLSNPNSVQQLMQWLSDTADINTDTLRKDDVTRLLGEVSDTTVREVLTLRKQMSKTSVKKYEAIQSCVCRDGRVRGLLQFYGANRTGRWAGRLVQVQNLPQNKIEGADLDLARLLARAGAADDLEQFYGNVPDTLSWLIRTAFVASDGNMLLPCDASAIEARIIAWLAGEQWRLEVFRTHGKIYEASASQMFKVPLEQIGKGSPLRQKGKIAELALGYGGGIGALTTMGALKMGLTESDLQPLVDAWREANPAITRLWRTVEAAAIKAVETGMPQTIQHGIQFYCKKGVLFIQLPSGRTLSYMRPKLQENRFGKQALTYEGMNQTTKQWQREDTYGGKLVENITQAVARDCLATAMLRIAPHYGIVLHVHDEVVLDTPADSSTVKHVEQLMSEPIEWAKGLPLAAEGFTSPYYKK